MAKIKFLVDQSGDADDALVSGLNLAESHGADKNGAKVVKDGTGRPTYVLVPGLPDNASPNARANFGGNGNGVARAWVGPESLKLTSAYAPEVVVAGQALLANKEVVSLQNNDIGIYVDVYATDEVGEQRLHLARRKISFHNSLAGPPTTLWTGEDPFDEGTTEVPGGPDSPPTIVYPWYSIPMNAPELVGEAQHLINQNQNFTDTIVKFSWPSIQTFFDANANYNDRFYFRWSNLVTQSMSGWSFQDQDSNEIVLKHAVSETDVFDYSWIGARTSLPINQYIEYFLDKDGYMYRGKSLINGVQANPWVPAGESYSLDTIIAAAADADALLNE